SLTSLFLRDPQTPDIYPLSLHDALPISLNPLAPRSPHLPARAKSVIWLFMEGGPSHLDLFDPKPALEKLAGQPMPESFGKVITRSEEHTSELQSRGHLVCRLLLEKKKHT